MTSKIKIKRGTKAQLPALELAEPGFTTDTKELYIGDGIGNVKIGGSVDFLGLNDTPSDYIGNEDSYLQTTSSGIVFVARSTATGFVYTDIPTTVTGTPGMGSITFSVESPVFNISPVFNNNVIWLSRSSIGTLEDCFWARASDDNTYLNWGSGDHFYLRDNNAVTHYDFSSDGLDMDDNNLNTTGYVSATTFYGDGSNLTGVSGTSGSFIGLIDTPSSYTGNAGKAIIVAQNETELDYISLDLVSGTIAMMVYNTVAQTNIDTAESLRLEGTTRLDNGFSMGGNNSTEITISGSGWYEFQYSVAWDSDYNNRSTMRVYVERNGSGSWQSIEQSYSYEYLRYNTYGRMSNNTASFFLNSEENEKFRIRMDGATTGSFPSSSVDTDTINNQCWTTIKSLDMDGIKGADGADGADGVDGAPGPAGSGSSMNIYDAGTIVSGTPFNIINFTGLDIEESVTSGTVNITYVPPVFGTWYGWATSEAQSTTTSTSWQQKLRYSLTGVPAGNYRIGYQWEWRRNATGNDFEARVQIDDTTTVASMNYESKDTNSWHLDQGFYIAVLTAGNHYIDIDYAGESASNTSYIRAARIECYRVS